MIKTLHLNDKVKCSVCLFNDKFVRTPVSIYGNGKIAFLCFMRRKYEYFPT